MKRALKSAPIVILSLLAACGGGDPSGPPSSSVQGRPDAQDTFGLGRTPGQSLDESIADNSREKAITATSVFRFAKISSGAYFYTGSSLERDIILQSYPDFRYEGAAFGAAPGSTGEAVYRFAKTDTGGYFFTANVAERDHIINSGAYPNFRYEGVTFSVAKAGAKGALPVYRLANLRNGAYLFTQDSGERAAAAASGFWRDEGVGFYAFASGHVIEDSPAPAPAPAPTPAPTPPPPPPPPPPASIKGRLVTKALTTSTTGFRGPPASMCNASECMYYSQSEGTTYGHFSGHANFTDTNYNPYRSPIPSVFHSVPMSPYNGSLYLGGELSTYYYPSGVYTELKLTGTALNLDADADVVLDRTLNQWSASPWFAQLQVASDTNPSNFRTCWHVRLPTTLRLTCHVWRKTDAAFMGAYAVDDSPGYNKQTFSR